jgi:hypothetical protein
MQGCGNDSEQASGQLNYQVRFVHALEGHNKFIALPSAPPYRQV